MNSRATRLLGSPQVELDGRPAALETRKATALLDARRLLEAGRP